MIPKNQTLEDKSWKLGGGGEGAEFKNHQKLSDIIYVRSLMIITQNCLISDLNIFRVLCQNLNDHNAVGKQTEAMINTCLNQTKYKRYISDIKQVSFKCKESSAWYCLTQFMIHPKSDQILEYKEMLIVDEIALLGNLGGLLGLFVGFSVFGYASYLVDLILEKIKPENTMRVSMLNQRVEM